MPRPSPIPPRDPSRSRGAAAPDAIFRVGDTIVCSGVYRVLHDAHRASHYVVLLAGQEFPRCSRCAGQVRFQLVEATTDIKSDPDFRVHPYEIPHPPPAPGEEEPAQDEKKDDEVA